LAYKEFMAHDNIVALLRLSGFSVIPNAWGVETSFQAEYGDGGRLIVFNAEYDALPEIGHACGHNLIATAALAAFFGVAAALRQTKRPGRVRLLGTPAEEGGGGKIKLINAGAYEGVNACLMVHPAPSWAIDKLKQSGQGLYTGSAYYRSLSVSQVQVTFTGRPAHAAMTPHQGVNALDAVVMAYNAISMLRQQIHPQERIHGVITDGGAKPSIIPGTASMFYYIRSGTMKETESLMERVIRCFDGAAKATGCTVEYQMYVSNIPFKFVAFLTLT
jgi:amidohydrolase